MNPNNIEFSLSPLESETTSLASGRRGRAGGLLPVLGALGTCALILSGSGTTATELGATFNPSNGQVAVTLTGGTGRWHCIEASTNLLNWGGVTNLYQASPSSSAWTDTGASNSSQHFFRSRDLTTALDTYVATPDTNYSYTLLSTLPGAGYTAYVLELRSQVWLTTNEVDRVLWKHWLVIVKPDGATNSQSFLWIDGGSNPGTPPTGNDSTLLFFAQVALDTKTVVSWLKMVPNEPLTFAGETSSRTEDGIIVYTWDKYMKTGDERWPARLPMTKAAVRAMDTVTTYCGGLSSGALTVDKFVVGGGSKRGWTTWTTAAVDRRVTAIIPASIDVLNVGACLVHQYCAYGAWSYAIADYTVMGIMTNYGTPQFDALMNIEDPYSYRVRLTMPKFELYGAGDQYFLPDSSQFYFNDLPGVKYMRCIPNADHGLNTDAYYNLWAYYQSIILKTPLPQFTWTLQSSNTVRVVASDAPSSVTLWQAANASARDFRLSTIGAAWTSTTLTDQGGGVYLGAVSNPSQGWKAFFVELDYNRSGLQPLKFTTQVYVVPDTLPYTWPPPP
jgi:PhoPQ-activated pathogenicity-related protein